MLYLVGMLVWEVKVEGSRLRYMGERPGTRSRDVAAPAFTGGGSRCVLRITTRG